MTNLSQVKHAVCEAIDRHRSTIEGARSVRVDMKFGDDGTICKVVLFAEHEFVVRAKPQIERYEMNS